MELLSWEWYGHYCADWSWIIEIYEFNTATIEMVGQMDRGVPRMEAQDQIQARIWGRSARCLISAARLHAKCYAWFGTARRICAVHGGVSIKRDTISEWICRACKARRPAFPYSRRKIGAENSRRSYDSIPGMGVPWGFHPENAWRIWALISKRDEIPCADTCMVA